MTQDARKTGPFAEVDRDGVGRHGVGTGGGDRAGVDRTGARRGAAPQSGQPEDASVMAIRRWLMAIGLGGVADTFEENDIDLDIVAELSEDDLTKLGLTLGQRRAAKGGCLFSLEEVVAHGAGQVFVVLPPEDGASEVEAGLQRLADVFPGDVFLGARALYLGDDARRLAALAVLAQKAGVGLAACNDVRLHQASRKPLLDIVTCIREHCTIDTAGYRLDGNAERHLKKPEAMAHLFRAYPEALANTLEVARRCRFSLDELRHDYPEELTGTAARRSRNWNT